MTGNRFIHWKVKWFGKIFRNPLREYEKLGIVNIENLKSLQEALFLNKK